MMKMGRRQAMRLAGFGALLLILCSAVFGMGRDEMMDFDQDLAGALANMGMSTPDLRIRHDYATPDVFRLPLIDSLMHDPASMLARTDEIAGDLEAESLLAEIAWLLWYSMSVEPDSHRDEAVEPVGLRDVTGNHAHLPRQTQEAFSRYLDRLSVARNLRLKGLEAVGTDLGFLCDTYPSLVSPDEEYEEMGPFELHAIEKAEEALTDSVLALSERIDIQSIASMSYVACQAAEDLRVDIETSRSVLRDYARYSGGSTVFEGEEVLVTGSLIYLGSSEMGPIVIGGPGRNTYQGCFALIVDVGGDDTYGLTNQPDVKFRHLVDLSGNDLYESGDSAGVAGIVFGTSILMDLQGDDTYRTTSISLGAGICGMGMLYDRAGDDCYISDTFSQGAGFLGLGILKDGAGNDTYSASTQSQAFGYVMGSGLLYDAGGNDTYYTKMARTDILRYDDHYLTLSQGCAFGSRPDYSGGIGLLIDSWGNDLYSSDIFGQGVAYWFALGALIDRGGHDRYCSYQYAQGAGIHLAFGLLLDESGDDFYQSKGVSHGCGHDLSLGLLADLSGNDCYTATDLSQGAGNANGTGILYDADGTDSYSAKSTVNVNGYGNYRREFGSIGIHIDSRGRDFYAARGGDGSLWESGRYGLGLDAPAEARKPSGDIVVNDYPFQERSFTSEDLFILSSRGEPRFRQWREYAFDSMVADTAATIEYLRTVLDTKDARERHTIKDILRRIAEPAVPMLAEAVRSGNDRARTEASWILGLIGDHRGFDALLELSQADAWKLRSSALNAIGKLKALSDEDRDRLGERIVEVFTDPDEVFYVKKDAAYSVGGQGLCDLLPLLVGGLDNDHYSVRFSCSEAIRDLTEAGCSDVAQALGDQIADMSTRARVAALHAAQVLPTDERLDVAAAALEFMAGESEALAIARIIRTTEPETNAQKERIGKITEALPAEFWSVRALLAPTE
jgi:HEAT repeat protein